MANVCVFCGARSGNGASFETTARQLGEFLGRNSHTLVYGGGSTGIMGAVADAILALNGRIIGVIPAHLARPELMHHGVADMRVTRDMHERKALMHSLSEIYVALPGGFGTMEELFEAVTWAQLELHARPIAILNVDGVYDGLVQLVQTMATQGFLSDRCRQLLTVCDTIEQLTAWISSVASSAHRD